MCFKVNEQCPRCGVRTGVVYYHKQDKCPNDPMTCNVNVEKDLRATGSRFLDLRCKTPGCLFSHTERERIEAQYHGLGPRVIIVTPNGTIRLDEEIADLDAIKAASILTGERVVAKKEETSKASLPGLRPDGKPAAKSESVGRVELPMHQHPSYRIVTEYERDEQGSPVRRPLGRTRLPNGRMPLPDSRPPLASLGIRDQAPSSREIAVSGRFAPSDPNPQRNNNTNTAANAGTINARGERQAPIPRFKTSPTAAALTANAKTRAKTTNESAKTPETEAPTDSPNGSTHTPRQGWSGRRLPEIPGRNGMTAVLVSGADRPPKWQYRSVGRLRLEDLPPKQAEEIRKLKARMDERITWQTSVVGGATMRAGGGVQGPRYVLEEDQLLQLLRLSGFGYEQIQREFIPRRSQDSLTVRRKGHKRGIHVRGFEYIPDNGFMNAASETDSGESGQAPGQQEGGGQDEGGASGAPTQQDGAGEEEGVFVTAQQDATGQEENGSGDANSESDAREGDGSDDAKDADDEHEADDANDADDEHEADDADDDSDTSDANDGVVIINLSESGSSDSEEGDDSDDVSDGCDADNEEDFGDGDNSDFDMDDPTYNANAMIQANDNNGDTPLLDIIKEEETPVEEQVQVPAPTAGPCRVIYRERGTVNTTSAVDTADTAETVNAESAASTANIESTATAVDTSPGSSLKRKRDVYDLEDSDDEATSKAMKADEE